MNFLCKINNELFAFIKILNKSLKYKIFNFNLIFAFLLFLHILCMMRVEAILQLLMHSMHILLCRLRMLRFLLRGILLLL